MRYVQPTAEGGALNVCSDREVLKHDRCCHKSDILDCVHRTENQTDSLDLR